MIVMGLSYIFNRAFARKFFYVPNAFGKQVSITQFIPERLGINFIRFIIGPALVIAGVCLIYKVAS